MTKHNKTFDDKLIANVVLRLAAKGWTAVSFASTARAAKIPLGDLTKRFVKVTEFVPLVAKEIDQEAFAAVPPTTENAHDQVFDLLMSRFDVMQKHRAAILAIDYAARHDCALSRALAQATLDGVYRILEALPMALPLKIPRALVAAGLCAVYGWGFLAWRKDDTKDLSKTMAALDRALRWAGRVTFWVESRK